MTFKDQQLNSMTFQAWKMKFLNSMTFQVFHDLCTNPVFGLLECEHCNHMEKIKYAQIPFASL